MTLWLLSNMQNLMDSDYNGLQPTPLLTSTEENAALNNHLSSGGPVLS